MENHIKWSAEPGTERSTRDENRKYDGHGAGGGSRGAVQLLADYITGMAKAWSAGALCSRTGVKGIVKKVGYLMVVGAAGAADWLIRYGLAQAGIEVQFSFLIAAMVIIWLIVNELISILENVAAMGGPVPAFLSKLLARLKNVVEKKAEGEQHGDS